MPAGATGMTSKDVVDAQLHAWLPDCEELPWQPASVATIPPERAKRYAASSVSAEQLTWMMDAVGVNAAVLTSPFIYGDDHRYAFRAAAEHPGRFRVVAPMLQTTPDVERRIETFLAQPWALGIRVVSVPGHGHVTSTAHQRIYAAAQAAGVPLFIVAKDMLESLPSIARAYPSLLLVLDHLGLTSVDPNRDRLAMLPDLLALADYDNVVVKCSAAPDLSTEPFPFMDLWPHLHRILDAFGVERVLWGTDITQHFDSLTYCEALDFIRRSDQLSEPEKTLILGANARRILPWPDEVRSGRQTRQPKTPI